VVPDHLAQTFASARRAMDDMPMGDTDYGPEVWHVHRVRSVAEVVERRGDRLTTVAAVEESSGTIAGFTQLVVPGDGEGDAQHYGTGVLPEHRGHSRHPDLHHQSGLIQISGGCRQRLRIFCTAAVVIGW
jgi:hypothetical protein